MSNSTAHLDTQVPFTLSLPLPHTPPLLLLLLTVHATVLQLPLPHLLRQFTGSVTASTSVAPVSVTTPSLPAFSHSTEASPVSNSFKCEQCNYPNVTNKGLMQHICIKHRIYQIDGTHDLDEECQTNSDEVLLKMVLLPARQMMPLLRYVKYVKWTPHYVLFLLTVPWRSYSKQDRSWLLNKQRPE